jgi:ABC-type uncharacterized transport system permease subunit
MEYNVTAKQSTRDLTEMQQGLIDLFVAGSRPVIAIVLAFFVAGIIILLQGKSPLEAYSAVARGSFGSLVAIGNTCVRTTPLLIGALGMTLGIRGGHFNVGGEGQLAQLCWHLPCQLFGP